MDKKIARTGAQSALAKGRTLLDEARAAFDSNDYALAAKQSREAADLFHAGGDTLALANALGWNGAALTQQSLYQEALVQLNASIELFRDIGRMERASRPLNYMAIVYEELGDVDKAFALYEEALAKSRMADDAEMEGRILANIGDAWVNQHQHEKALAYLAKAATVLEPLPMRGIYAWCLQAMARIYSELGDHAFALEFFKKAQVAADEGPSVRTRAEVNCSLGSLYVEMGDREAAFIHLQRALDLATSSGVRQVVFKTHLAMSQAYERFGETDLAYRHFKEYHNERSALIDEVAKAKIHSLTAEIELVKVRHEQEIYQLRNVELARVNSQLEEQRKELERLSVHDSLTGVYNRRYLDRQLDAEFDRSRRYDQPLSAAIIDADDFKNINDRFSHAIGDATLTTLVSIIGSLTRRSDTLARFGGDEFVILFPNTPLNRAITACEKIRVAIELFEWGEIHPELSVTVSIGVASSDGASASAELMHRADERLYVAKNGGRNAVVG